MTIYMHIHRWACFSFPTVKANYNSVLTVKKPCQAAQRAMYNRRKHVDLGESHRFDNYYHLYWSCRNTSINKERSLSGCPSNGEGQRRSGDGQRRDDKYNHVLHKGTQRAFLHHRFSNLTCWLYTQSV